MCVMAGQGQSDVQIEDEARRLREMAKTTGPAKDPRDHRLVLTM